jgi:glutamate--cysteine ligase catalytic subunit
MEVQLTDFENAAFVVFMALLTRTIRFFNLNFYIPITKVHDTHPARSDLCVAVRARTNAPLSF